MFMNRLIHRRAHGGARLGNNPRARGCSKGMAEALLGGPALPHEAKCTKPAGTTFRGRWREALCNDTDEEEERAPLPGGTSLHGPWEAALFDSSDIESVMLSHSSSSSPSGSLSGAKSAQKTAADSAAKSTAEKPYIQVLGTPVEEATVQRPGRAPAARLISLTAASSFATLRVQVPEEDGECPERPSPTGLTPLLTERMRKHASCSSQVAPATPVLAVPLLSLTMFETPGRCRG